MFQNNAAWDYADVATAAHSYTGGAWHKVEIEVTGAGQFQGRLYSSDGATLLTAVSYSFGSCALTGVAIRSFDGMYIDTIVHTHF